MTSSLESLRALIPLLDSSYRVEQMKMRRISDRIADLKDQLACLERPQSPSQNEVTPATLAGTDLKWERWVKDRKTLINQELALTLRDREQVKIGLKAALAQREAAKSMARAQHKKALQQKERRSSW